MSAAEENWDSVYSGVCGLVDRMITSIILDPPLMAFLCQITSKLSDPNSGEIYNEELCNLPLT